ncbi:hypothetical protein SEA_RASPUTIA_40 [Microbacterium phage Rasputia]|nr:hypothetical protein SEA_RASPUTIA_40 [Microbacterium phage Rasputia]
MSDWNREASERALRRKPEPLDPPVKARPKTEVIPEGTTLYISQRMPDGRVRDLEINAAAIVGAIDLRSSFTRKAGSPVALDPSGSATGAHITLQFDLRPVQSVPNEEAWMMRFIDRDEVESSDVPVSDHLLWGTEGAR